MTRQLASQMARILTEYSSPVQPGDYVTIIGHPTTAEPLIAALYEAVLARGGFPNIQMAAPISPDYHPYYELLISQGSDAQLDHLDSTMMHWVNESDALFFIKASANTKALSALDPARLNRYRTTIRPFSSGYLGRYARDELRWTVVGWPTAASAQEAEMGLMAYTDFVAKACGLDQPDPVAYWQGMRTEQERLVAWLADKQRLEVRGPGIELSMEFGGRVWVSCHGELNFPDGEIFTSPHEATVSGHVAFNYPSVYQGYEVSGVKLRFEDGVVVEASAAKGEDFLLSQLDLDDGARMLGEFAIGTNMGVQQVTGSTLFDEKIGGSIHMALGRAYEEAKGTNDSVIHWDMVHDMGADGEIIVDGELFYRGGKFMV